jgi:hypothetical protein
MAKRPNRREFLRTSAAAASAGYWIAGTANAWDNPKSANEKLNVAIVGAGGRGSANLGEIAKLGENIVALCDVDDARAAGAYKAFPNAKKYHDFRKMLDEMKEIDAVVVSTPDHTHAPVGVRAMRMGKHCYCEKPLTHTVYEARLMRETAAKHKVATQMGNQGTSNTGLRKAAEFVQGGGIGQVKEVHVWTNRPIWPQGGTRPTEKMDVPATLQWDLWLGPAADRPFHKAYVPFSWRGWWDFGTGALGDMACHTANMAFMACKLGFPTSVEAESSPINPDSFPAWSKVKYQFPQRGDLAPLTWTWYDGKVDGKPNIPHLEQLKNEKVGGSGSVLIGDKGVLYSPSDYGAEVFILADGKREKLTGNPEKLPVSPGHHKEFVIACKGGPAAMSNFDYAAFLTEVVVLGNVALRLGKKIEWDGPNMKATNTTDAEALVKGSYRSGWEI